MMNTLMKTLIILTAFLSSVVGAGTDEENFRQVELDRFIESEKAMVNSPLAKGKKIIMLAAPVSFRASLKRHPEEKNMSYVYTALAVSRVDPMPVIEHRMFIESDAGNIIPVYVEKNAVPRINAELKEEQQALFRGYHVYNYAKGPAILVVDFDRVAP